MHIGPNIVEDGLVLYLDAANKKSYPGTGTDWFNLVDSSVSGSLINGPTFNRNKFEFDGNDQQTTISDINLSSDFTLNFLVNITDELDDENRKSLLQLSGSFSNVELSSNTTLSINNLNSISYHFYVGTLQLNQYYQITITRDSSNIIRTYINGELTDTSSEAISSTLIIDSIASTKNLRNFKGSIATVSIYNTALSLSRILQNYNALYPRYGKSSPSINDNITSDIQKFKALVRNQNHIFEAEDSLYTQLSSLDTIGLYNSASLILTGNGVGESTVYCIKPYGYTASFTRGTTSTRIDSQGYVQGPTDNLLPNTTNFLDLSEGGLWEKYRVVRYTNTTESLAPDGTYTALKLVDTSDSGAHRIRKGSFIPDGGVYNISFFAKKAELDYVNFATDSYIGSQAFFDLNSGQTGFISGERNTSNGSSNTYSSSMQYYGDGWYKCSLKYSLNLGQLGGTGATLSGEGFAIGLAIGTGSGDDSYIGSGQGIYLWGGELTLTSSINQEFTALERNYNLPLIDYSGGEPAIRSNVYAENYLRYSEDFTNDVWVKSNMEVTSDTTLAPNNRVAADTLTAASASATIRQTQNMTNRICLFAVYLKRKTGTGNVYIKAGNVSSSVDLTTDFQRFVVDGPIYSGTYTASNGEYEITTTNYPHGLQVGDRIRFNPTGFSGFNDTVDTVINDYTFTINSGTTTESGDCNIQPHTVEILIEQQGDEIYAWGAQASGTGYSGIDFSQTKYENFNYAKEYLPTLNSSFNRSNEILILDNLYTDNISSSGSGCIFFDIANSHTINYFYTGVYAINIRNELDELVFTIEHNKSSIEYWRVRYGASRTLFTSPMIVPNLLEFHKLCINYNSTTADVFFDGTKITSYSIPQPALNLNINKIGTGNTYQIYKNISVYPYLTDQQCESLTSL